MTKHLTIEKRMNDTTPEINGEETHEMAIFLKFSCNNERETCFD
jgi:hypothetical protein